MRFPVARPRQLVALVQLLLFVFSASTSILPCAHGSRSGAERTPSHHAVGTSSAPDHHNAHHAGVVVASTTDVPSHQGPRPLSPDNNCPWVIGCVGIVQVDLDAPWRTHESATQSVVPVGMTLRQSTADRDVESPPPRV